MHGFRTQFLSLMYVGILAKLHPVTFSCILVWVFSCKFLQYFENTFLEQFCAMVYVSPIGKYSITSARDCM